MTPPAHRAPEGALRRAMAQVTLGTALRIQARAQREAQVAIRELDLQYQVPISGTADSGPAFSTVTLEFDVDFFYAPGQRDSELTRPHMTFGGEADGEIMLTATVTDWTIDDDNGAITGCTVAVGAVAATSTAFKGLVHLNFQGWGAIREADSDLG